MKKPIVSIGHRIRLYRDRKEYSQQQLATKLGIVQPLISLLESGERYPSVNVLIRLNNLSSTDFPLYKLLKQKHTKQHHINKQRRRKAKCKTSKN